MELVYSALASLAVAVLSFVLQSVIRENRRLKKEHEDEYKQHWTAIKEGLQCMLRDTLIANHKKYMELGYISTHGLQNWLLMYKAYHALGGNGMIDHMKEEIEELPMK